MPSSRLLTYLQNNFYVGERKSSLSLDQSTASSAQEITNYRVLKSGAIRRRAGTRKDFSISGSLDASSEILKFLEFFDGYVVLARRSNVITLHYIDSSGLATELTPSAYRVVSYSLSSLSESSIVSLGTYTDILATYDVRPLVLRDIEELGVSIFLIFETGLPYRLFISGGKIFIAPYYYKVDMVSGYDDFIRSLPLSNLRTVFSDVFFLPSGGSVPSSESVLTIGNENLDAGTCTAFLSLTGTLDVDTTMVDTSKMGLRDYLYKPIIFNVLPSTPEVIPFDVGSVYRRGTGVGGVPSVELAYLADWDLEGTYSSVLLSNLNDTCRIQSFSYNPVINSAAAAAVGDSTNIIGSKAQLIRELLYGRKYMVIPYEVVGESEDKVGYHTALPQSSVLMDAVTSISVNVEPIGTGLVRANADTFSALVIRNYTLRSSGNTLIKGTIRSPVSTFNASTAAAGYSMIRVPFPDRYTQLISGVRGERFNQLPWGTVVTGDWLSFIGFSISRGTLGTEGTNEVLNRNVEITLHASELDDGSKVFEDVSRILVSNVGTEVNNNTAASATVASFTANLRSSPDTSRSRRFRYSAGGNSFSTSETSTPQPSRPVTDPLFLTRQIGRDDFNTSNRMVGVYKNSSGRVLRVYLSDDDIEPVVIYDFNYGSSRATMSEEAERDILYYTSFDKPVIESIVESPLRNGFFIIYRASSRASTRTAQYSEFIIDRGDISLPVPGIESPDGSSYYNFDGNATFNFNVLQCASDNRYVYLLTGRNDGRGRLTVYTQITVGVGIPRLRYSHSTTIFLASFYGSLASFTISGSGRVTILTSRGYVFRSSGIDVRRRAGFSNPPIFFTSVSPYARLSRDISYLVDDRDGRLYGIYRDDLYTFEVFPQTPLPPVITRHREEVSILKEFFIPTVSNEGAVPLKITLITDSGRTGFQGFDVIPYNTVTDTVFGYNTVINNEYISDNRHATGAFDFPSLAVGGSSSVGLGSITGFGRHLIATEDGNFYTWFLNITKGGTLSDLSTIYLRIGGENGSTYTLLKQSIVSLEGNVEVYIQAVADFDSVSVDRLPIPSPVTIELFSEVDNASPHTFMSAEFNNRTPTVYANCLIFELSMPSPVRKDGVRVIGGNDFNLGYTTSKVCYSSDDYNYSGFATFDNNFNLIRGDTVSYFYQNENKSNNFTRILNNPSSEDIKDLFIQSRYLSGSFNQAFASVIPLYLLSTTSQSRYVITNSPQVQTFDNYINKVGFASQVDYTKKVIDPRGRSVNLTSAVSSFDGEGIFVSSEEGLYSVPAATGSSSSLVHNQRFKYKPLVFHNRFVFISPDNLFITQVRSRERLGLKSNTSGADQVSLLDSVVDIVFDQDKQIYMMPNMEGDIVVATDFDTSVAGFAIWKFGDNVKCLKLLVGSTGIKGIFKLGDTEPLSVLSFDNSIVEDFKEGLVEGKPFTSRVVSNSLISNDTLDTGLFRGKIQKIQIEHNLCNQIKVEFTADNVTPIEYDYIVQDSKGVNLDFNRPLDVSCGVVGYNPKVIISQDGIEDNKGTIYGYKYTGVLDGV